MSILETHLIDAIAKSDDNKIIFLITDHLDWNNEYEHLNLLQDKINAYLGFIESEQYIEMYGEDEYKEFIIQISFLEQPSKNGWRFIEVVSKQLSPFNIKIEVNNI